MMLATIAFAQTVKISGVVVDRASGDPLLGASIKLNGRAENGTVADMNGRFSISVQRGHHVMIGVSYIGYKTKNASFVAKGDTLLTFAMDESAQLKEVVVTAKSKDTPVTTSVIGREAMQHLQPNSLTDLMELLPGGYSKDPSMGSANTLSLRETGTRDANGNTTHNSDYDISSLGTLFVVDGAPLQADANMQYSPLASTQGGVGNSIAENNRNTTNRGIDMRSISTDDIESVEVVRGIPSVEYGNMTSGMINIQKIRRAMPLTMRFKADGYSKLFSAGRGFNIGNRGYILNLNADYMDSKVDPTNNLENYKRITGSLRLTKKTNWGATRLTWNSALDYTGSFDNSKQDPDINYGRIDEYKSTFNRMSLTSSLNLVRTNSFLRELSMNFSLSGQLDKLREEKLVAPQRYGIIPTSYDEGEYEAKAVFSEYIAKYECDGKPVNGYLKLMATLHFEPIEISNDIKLGGDYTYSKNYGKGQVYDLEKPISLSGWSSRPRTYSSIPALQTLSAFVEDRISKTIGTNRIEAMIGVRATMLPGLGSAFDMSGKLYADPRMNLRWQMPHVTIGGKNANIALSGGVGWTTKMPTLNYLYPDKYYTNFTGLSYYDAANPRQDSHFVITSYIQDPTNYNLKPARNRKVEVRLDFDWDNNSFSVDYFRESMTSGFRYKSIYDVYSYRSYDVSQMAAGVDYRTIGYENRQVLDGYRQASNGTRVDKEGVELQFTSKRIAPLRTRINVTGAWFRTVYTNSQPMYETVSMVIDNTNLSQKYVGLYDWNDGRENSQLNTNVTFDTQIPEWGLVFTTSAQFMWFIRTKLQEKQGTPIAYLSAVDGNLHPYTAESSSDTYLQHLVKTYNKDSFRPFTVPMSMVINFKATKQVGRYMKLSFFANKLIDYLPDYESNGYTIRRNVSPYFGVEANLTF